MSIQKQIATVYFGGGRRYFSLGAACIGEARSIMHKSCGCEPGDGITPPIICAMHDDHARYCKRLHRLARRIKQQYRRAQS